MTQTNLGAAAPISKAELALNKAAQAEDYRIARDNAAFAKASPARKRVIIARDVLKWLAAGKIQAKPGTYLSHWVELPDGELSTGRVEDNRVDGGKCQACALGAVFACAVEREGGTDNFWRHHSDSMRNHLAPYFSEDQLLLIEVAFERNSAFAVGLDAYDAEAFGKRYDDASERMTAIMTNIIKNRGTFRPEQEV